MKQLLALPTWMIFLFLIVPSFMPISTLAGVILTKIYVGILVLGIYFLGISLFKKLPQGHDLNLNYFHFNLLFPLVYFIIVFVIFDEGFEISTANAGSLSRLEILILPIHFYAMFCMFYVIWFLAKMIATIENNRVVKFDEFAGNFFLIWFFPIGIWWIYPKVRMIFSVEIDSSSEKISSV